MKRTSGGLQKRAVRMHTDGRNNTTTNEGRHDETEIDPIKQDWHVFRGPPDYTHTSLPAIYVNNVNVQYKMFEAGIRLTSPYQPFYATQVQDINPDVTGITNVLEVFGDPGFDTQYWGFYSQLYKYYSVISCRYRVTAENYGSEAIWMHVMNYNQEKPPMNVSNEDMQLWRGVRSHYMTPHAAFYDIGGVLGNGGVRQETSGYNFEDTGIASSSDATAFADLAVARKNQAVIVLSDQYNAGDFTREVALDSEISTWTTVTSNPSYPENLLIRFNTDEASTGQAGDVAVTRGRRIQVNLRMEVEYLCEFKELTSEVRYPTKRDPITLTFSTTASH